MRPLEVALESPRRLSIRIAGNTITPCLQVIVGKGYSVAHYLGETPDDPAFWDANKDGRYFSATGAEELLGLIAMWEQRGDDWHQKLGEREILDKLLSSDDGGPADA